MAADLPPPPGPPPAPPPPGGAPTPPPPPTTAAAGTTAPATAVAAARRGRGRLVAGLVILVIVLVGAGAGGAYLVLRPSGKPVATAPTSSARATASPSASVAPTPTATPALPGAASISDLTTVASALFPMTEGGGRNTCFQGDTTFAQCPVTARLRSALEAVVATQTGGGGDPICGCQNSDPQAVFSYATNTVSGGGTIHITSFGGSDREDIVVVAQNGAYLADDLLYCTASPPASIYPNEGAMC